MSEKADIQRNLKLTPKYCIILVVDLEDFSLWCQTVDNSVVGELYRRFYFSGNVLSELFKANYIKSTGDGLIIIWSHVLGDFHAYSFVESHQKEILVSIERATTVAQALQLLTLIRFCMPWPIPRFLRCAIHAGVLSELEYVDTTNNSFRDFIGEPLNTACRMEKFGQDLPGPVLTEHVGALLMGGANDTLIPLPLVELLKNKSFPKSAEWVSIQPFCFPSAQILNAGPESTYLEDDMKIPESILSAFSKNIEIAFFHCLEACYTFYLTHGNEAMASLVPSWLDSSRLYFHNIIRPPIFKFDDRLLDTLFDGLKKGVDRFRSIYPNSDLPPEEFTIPKLKDAFRAIFPAIDAKIKERSAKI